MAQELIYTGSSLGTTHRAELTPLPSMAGGQDGTILGNHLFRFFADGQVKIYTLPAMQPEGEFLLDKSELLRMHCNAVDFSDEFYQEGDPFPLVYTNIYNNYSGETDPAKRLEGVCGVYRIFRTERGYSSRLVQVIRVGFTYNEKLWCSPGHSDVRPYGNFVVDRKGHRLIAFTMRDADYHSRVISFRLPSIDEGEYNSHYGCRVLVLREEDILSSFNGGYSHYLQGACVWEGKLYSTEGFDGPEVPAAIRVFDLEAGREVAHLPLFSWGYEYEPEFIARWEDGFVFSNGRGEAWKLRFE